MSGSTGDLVVSRRAVLRAGLVLPLVAPLAACTRGDEAPAPLPPDPDLAVRTAALQREQALLAAYDAALLGAPPARAALLRSLRAEHAVHRDALAALAPAGPPTPAASTAAGTAAPAPGPAVAAGAPVDLVAVEAATSTAHAEAVPAASRALAGLLASLAAAEAAHGVALA